MHPEVNKVRLTVLIALLFSALCAGVFRTPPIMFMAALLTSAPLMGFLIGRLSSRYLRVTREVPECGTAGDLITGHISVTNRARWPIFLVRTCCGFAPAPDTRLRGLWKQEGTPAIAPAGSDEQVVPMLRGRSRFTWQQQWRLRRRGVFMLEPARSGVLDPLQLGNYMPVRSAAQRIVVLPRAVHLEQLGLLGGGGQEQHLPRHSTVVADAMDFHGVRPWVAGEAIRRAHWKSTARTGQLHVIEWEEAPASDLAILLDTGAAALAGDEENNTLETAITAAASIALHLLEHGCRVQLFYFMAQPSGDTAEPPLLKSLMAHSVARSQALLHALAEIKPLTHPEVTSSRLVADALPQTERGIGTLLIASSRSDAAVLSSEYKSSLRILLVDADSFASLASEPDASTPAVASASYLRLRSPSRRATASLRYGEPINAVLEARW
jgi:uncharacterized protein (DUF58 family)